MSGMNEPRTTRSSARRARTAAAASTSVSQTGPSTPRLLRSIAISLAVAAMILVLFVLPVEYGIDVTGAGDALGLTRMANVEADGHAPSADGATAPAATVSKTLVPMRTDSISITLPPGEGAEVKAQMQGGESMVFEWVSEGGPVNFDMHGEAIAGESTSYWAGTETESGAGVFVAPVDGTHGWFWRNRTDGIVEVTVQTSGFYERLFRAE